MKCPFCGSLNNRVVDKRAVKGTDGIRRRRECLKCFKRFTTYEEIGNLELMVIKKDGRRELFSREKLKVGITKALEKRPSLDKAEELVDKTERRLRRRGSKEVTSRLIGQIVLSEFKKLDMVAYLRFASVYRQFDKPEDFAKELTSLDSTKGGNSEKKKN